MSKTKKVSASALIDATLIDIHQYRRDARPQECPQEAAELDAKLQEWICSLERVDKRLHTAAVLLTEAMTTGNQEHARDLIRIAIRQLPEAKPGGNGFN